MWSNLLWSINCRNFYEIITAIISFFTGFWCFFCNLLVSDATSPKRLNKIFSVRFRPFPVVSARFGVLSEPLNSTVSTCSGAVCGQTCGQKALLDQVRHPLPPPVQKGSFYIRVWGIVPLERVRCKVFLRCFPECGCILRREMV